MKTKKENEKSLNLRIKRKAKNEKHKKPNEEN
jgi:hypothetical protein